MHKVVLCSGCTDLPKKIASKLEVFVADDCKIDVEFDYAVLGCAAIPHASNLRGEYDIVDLRMIEAVFENPEEVATAWIKSTLLFQEPEVDVVEVGYSVVYEGENIELISELILKADVTVVTTNPETIRKLYPFKVQVIEGKIEEVKGSIGDFEVVVGGIDLVKQQRGRFTLKAGQVITPQAKEQEGLFTYKNGSEYRAVLKAINNLGMYTKIKAIEVNYDACGTEKSGIAGCSLCFSCPTESIWREKNLKISLEKCIGCGFCASVCPVSAIHNAIMPSNLVIKKIDALVEQGKTVAFLCQNLLEELYERWKHKKEKLPEILPIFVPCINTLSEVHYLYAVLKGASVVAIPCKCEHARYDRAFEVARKTLLAFGFDCIRMSSIENLSNDIELLKKSKKPGKIIERIEGKTKRQIWLCMVENLLKFQLKADKLEVEQFGFIEIGNGCTLCVACSMFCPSGAIRRDAESGRIYFNHALCFACGLCIAACPENAISLQRVLDFSLLAERAIYKDEMLKCPLCSKPHISKSAYEKLSKAVGKHSILFCSDCRPKVILEAIYDELMGFKGGRR